MRKFIIVLSLFIFTVSGIITFKALGISSTNTAIKNTAKAPQPKSPSSDEAVESGLRAGEQAANRALVDELEATIAKLEDKLSNNNKEMQGNAGPGTSRDKAKVLSVLGSGAFSPGQFVLNEDLAAAVKALAPEIMSSPDHRVIIEGHTDNVPINTSVEKRYEDNMELSFLRAKAVARTLTENGIPLDRISVIGYGATRPVDSNKTREGRIKNRRVEIKLVPGDREF